MSTVALPATASNKAVWTGRVISALLTVLLLAGSAMNLAKPADVAVNSAPMGIPEAAIVPIGALLLVSTVLYAIPATAVLGAILLTGYFGGAVMTHLRVEGLGVTVVPAFVCGALVWLGLYLRDARVRALIPYRQPMA
jgi:hypothetical protein